MHKQSSASLEVVQIQVHWPPLWCQLICKICRMEGIPVLFVLREWGGQTWETQVGEARADARAAGAGRQLCALAPGRCRTAIVGMRWVFQNVVTLTKKGSSAWGCAEAAAAGAAVCSRAAGRRAAAASCAREQRARNLTAAPRHIALDVMQHRGLAQTALDEKLV